MEYTSLSGFYQLALVAPQTLLFLTNRDAIKFRMRMYSFQRRHRELGKLTILINGNELRAGPEGFDMAETIAELSPQTMEAIALKEKQDMEIIDKEMERLENERKKKKAFNPFELLMAKIPGPEEGGEKEDK